MSEWAAQERQVLKSWLPGGRPRGRGSWSISVEAGADSEELCGGDFGYSVFLKQTRFGGRMLQSGVMASVKIEAVKHPV